MATLYGLNRAVALRAVEAVQDAVPVGFEGHRQLLEGSELAAPRPSEPGGELRLSLLTRGRGHEDIPQGFSSRNARPVLKCMRDSSWC